MQTLMFGSLAAANVKRAVKKTKHASKRKNQQVAHAEIIPQIICNTCTGARYYQYKGVAFQNPFMWNSIKISSFIKLIEDFDHIDIADAEWSLTENVDIKKEGDPRCATVTLPNGTIGYFIHHHEGKGKIRKVPRSYKGEEDLLGENMLKYLSDKWLSRLLRLCKSNKKVVFVYCDMPGYDDVPISELFDAKATHPVIVISKQNLKNKCKGLFRCITSPEINTKKQAKLLEEFIKANADFINQ